SCTTRTASAAARCSTSSPGPTTWKPGCCWNGAEARHLLGEDQLVLPGQAQHVFAAVVLDHQFLLATEQLAAGQASARAGRRCGLSSRGEWRVIPGHRSSTRP